MNPLAYTLEGIAINEFNGDQTVTLAYYNTQVTGLEALYSTFDLPRYNFTDYGVLHTPTDVCGK